MKRTSSRLSKGSLDTAVPTPAPEGTPPRKTKVVNYAEPSDDEIDAMSVDSAGDDAADIKQAPKVMRNSIPMHEVERSSIDRLVQLSRYRTIFEPFITPKVLKQLNDVLINKPTVGDDDRTFTPQLITQPYCMAPACKMRSYQLEGLSFLVNNYHRSINCILADEMGLGKTLQSIACIAHLAIVKKQSGPYLVIVPLSVLFNWINEFKKWCPQLKVVRLHTLDKDEQLRLRKVLHNPDVAQVVVTTYDTIKTGGLSHSLRSIVWRAAFLDEGHRIKNENSEVSKACHGLRTRFRVILTGTPVQNNLHEFGALLSFLAPNIFTNLELFDSAFALKVSKVDKSPKKHHRSHSITDAKDGQSGNDAGADAEAPRTAQQIDRALLASAHYMMKPFVLRRLKSEVEQKLPPKYETKINCPMTDIQKDLTRALLFKEQALLSKLDGGHSCVTSSEGGTSGAAETVDKSKLMSLMAQLRKASNHPYLFPGIEKVAIDGLPTEEIVSASGKMRVLDKLLKKLYERGHRVCLFSQYTRTLDIISDFLDMRGYKHSRLDGSTNRVMREVKINLFNKPQSPQFIFCLSTRAGGEGVNLFTADTVILYDSDWNPQVDIQAMARVHRIGQTKVVHVYRLVTAGSVEECIVQRAQRKLFLDTMVNRGSTLQAKLEQQAAEEAAAAAKADKKSKGVTGKRSRTSSAGETKDGAEEDAGSEGEAEAPAQTGDGEEDESEPSKVFSAVKFGWNSVFSVSKQSQGELSDADIDKLIDRTRGGIVADPTAEGAKPAAAADAVVTDVTKSEGKEEGWEENQEFSIETFDEHAPLVSIRSFRVDPSDEKEDTAAAAPADISAAAVKTDAEAADAEGEQAQTAAVDVEAGSSTVAASRPKRNLSARTVDMMVEGLGVVKVSKFSLDPEDNGFSKVLDKRAARRKEQEALLYVSHSGRQVAGRDYHHQDMCNECWDGGELLVCDICPMAFHLGCIGLTKVPKEFQWFCPHHQCATCDRRICAAGLLFRCECCSKAYCEDCLPAEALVQGDCPRLADLGYRMPSNACYMLCSLSCKEYYDTEVAPEAAAQAAAPHQLEIVEQYEHEVGPMSGITGENESELRAPASSAEGAGGQQIMTHLDYALSNCSLADIRDRLGFPKTPDSAASIASVQNTSTAKGSDTNTRLTVRFTNLGEIPNFHLRLQKASIGIKSLLFRLTQDIKKYQETMKAASASTNTLNGGENAPAAAEEEALSVEKISTDIFNHKGVDADLKPEAIAKVFLHTVKTIARASRSEMYPLADVLGLSFVRPLLTPQTPLNYEPKFCAIREFSRQKLEEAIVAVLVLPAPQNLLMHKQALDTLPANAAPVDSLLLVARYLEALGEHCTDGNSQYFTALSLQQQDIPQLRHWTTVYPLGSRAPASLKEQWMAPAARLFGKLGFPLMEEKPLRQYLLVLYRKLYTEEGRRAAAAAAANAAARQQSYASTGTHPRAAQTGGSYADDDDSGEDNDSDRTARRKKARQAAADSKANTAAMNASQNAALSSMTQQQPAMDSKQELFLFLRWLNAQYDAMSKISQTRQSAATAAPRAPAADPAVPRLPKFPVAQEQRQAVMEGISRHLRGVLTAQQPREVVESVRRCEYELLLRAAHFQEYTDEASLPARLVAVINAHPEWRMPALAVGPRGLIPAPSGVVDLTADEGGSSDPTADPKQWRSLITEEIRQDMIFRVEKMLRLVSKQLNITTVEDLNHKIQQYEMGLIISSNSLEEYMDKGTLPKRLASLVTDFTEYKKTLTPQQLSS